MTIARPEPQVPRCTPTDTAGEVRAALAGARFECAEDVAVLEAERLVGLVPIEHLPAAASDAWAPRTG